MTKETKAIICGGRDFNDSQAIAATIRHAAQKLNLATVIHGGARGVDSLAGTIAANEGLHVIAMPAEWERFGRSAGYRRNEEMIRVPDVDMVIAFPGGKGTNHMVRLALSHGVVVHRVYYEDEILKSRTIDPNQAD